MGGKDGDQIDGDNEAETRRSMAVMRGQFSSAVLDEFKTLNIYYMIDDM